MSILYDLIFLVVALIYLPIYLFRRKFHRGFLSRFGILPADLSFKNRPIWIHAVSVGEAMAIKGLAERLREAYPKKQLVISTVTPTGNRIAGSIAKEGDFLTYLPLDLSVIIRSAVDKINPAVFIIVETELWPNLITHLSQKHIPIIVVNARISDASFRGYRGIRFLLKPVLNKVNLFCAQSQRDARRLVCLGADKDRVRVSGNMKFDVIDYTDHKVKLGLAAGEKLFLAASTHSTEEEAVLRVYKKLLADFPDLRLLIAPRHPERTLAVENIIIRYGFIPLRVSRLTGYQVSELNPPTRQPANPQTVFILDTVGQLMNYYAIADIVFMGGSLTRTGGHNILEPLSLGKPVLFGPYMFNFRDIADLFLENRAALSVSAEQELENKVKDLLNNPDKVSGMVKQAQGLIRQNQGATQRNLEYIRSYVKEA